MLPYRIETLFQHDPWANWTLFGATIATSLAIQFGLIPQELVTQYFVLGAGGSPVAFLGYLFAHAGITHLVGNMIFLWVFGNAVCATVGNWAYLGAYLGLGVFAGLIHQLVSATPVIGASGAITGVVGLAVAFYPVNRVALLYSFGFMTRTARVPLWGLALYWTAWDMIGAWLDLENVAYWAHLGGTAAGVGLGLALLATSRVQLTEFDHGSLLDSLLRRTPPHKARPGADESFARLQAAARAFRASVNDTAEPAAPAQPPAKGRLRLRLASPLASGFSDTPQRPPAAAALLPAGAGNHPSIQLTGGRPLAGPPAALGLAAPAPLPRPANAWPATLPEGRYFYFDGSLRHGPTSRTLFLGILSAVPNTSRWWFWVKGMKDWQRVSDLEGQFAAAGPAPPPAAGPTVTAGAKH